MPISPRQKKKQKQHERKWNGKRQAHVNEDAIEWKTNIYIKNENLRREF